MNGLHLPLTLRVWRQRNDLMKLSNLSGVGVSQIAPTPEPKVLRSTINTTLTKTVFFLKLFFVERRFFGLSTEPFLSRRNAEKLSRAWKSNGFSERSTPFTKILIKLTRAKKSWESAWQRRVGCLNLLLLFHILFLRQWGVSIEWISKKNIS